MITEDTTNTGYRTVWDFDFHEPKPVTLDQRAQMRLYYDNLKEFYTNTAKEDTRRPKIRAEIASVEQWIKNNN